MVGGSLYSTASGEKNESLKTTQTLFHASIVSFVGAVFLVMSFSSPYWLQSWEDTQSPFQNMGLWEMCFDNFRFPYFQFDKLWNGCHAMWGTEFRLIREWLMPWWLMVVQLFAVLAFTICFIEQVLLTCLLLRFPLEWVLRFEWQMVVFTTVCNGVISVLLFLCLAVFGGCCWDRAWVLYPNYNYVSWSYAVAGFSMLAHIVATYILFFESKNAKEKREHNNALVMQMYPPDHASLSTYHGSQYI